LVGPSIVVKSMPDTLALPNYADNSKILYPQKIFINFRVFYLYLSPKKIFFIKVNLEL